MKWYVLFNFFITGLSVVGLLVMFFNVDPYDADNLVKYLFFTSFFIALWCFSTLALNRFKIKIDWPDFYKSFKVGFIVAVAISVGYILVSHLK